MKKFKKPKILISILLIFLTFMPSVFAYYSSSTLVLTASSPTCKRYPMCMGKNVKLRKGQQIESYFNIYEEFMSNHPLKSISKNVMDMECYEQELRHIGACSYATALLKGCVRPDAAKFSENMVKLCNNIMGYPERFNKNLHTYIANYAYGLLGSLFKRGKSFDIVSNNLYKFSCDAHIYSVSYCLDEDQPFVPHVSQENFNLFMIGQ